MDSMLTHHVLIADDSQPTREALSKTLEGVGNLRVSQVENGAEAISFVEQSRPDLLLCDQHMPVLDGLQALKVLRRRWSAVELPILMLTGNKSVSDKVDAFRFGANDYLTKPLHREELLARVQAQLALKTAVQQNLAARDRLLQSSKLQTVGRLAAGLAHEINTPAQYVSDNLHFLQRSLSHLQTVLAPLAAWAGGEGPVPEPLARELRENWRRLRLDFVLEQAPQAVAQSLSGVERIATLIAELRAFTGEGSLEQWEPGNINDAITNAVAVSRGVWAPHTRIELDLQPDLPLALCYMAELNQVFLHLVYNASEAVRGDFGSPLGGPARAGCIQIRSRESGAGIEVLVSDDGPGVDAAIQGQIFDPFFTTKAVGGGTGQGLAVGYDVVVQRHAGRLSCERSSLGGACFRVWLPLEPTALRDSPLGVSTTPSSPLLAAGSRG
ncbi:MAG: response regulator [Deltaproteobacteria bacterium]